MGVPPAAWSRARATAYRIFYRLPWKWRHAVVRTVGVKYTIGAVTLVRDTAPDGASPGHRLLLLRQPPGRNWSLPGGLLKANERPVVGAARELAEETGLRLPTDQLRPAVPNALVHPDGRWIDMVFEARVSGEPEFTVDGGEVIEARFHPMEDLPPLTRQTGRLLGFYGIGPQAPGGAQADPGHERYWKSYRGRDT